MVDPELGVHVVLTKLAEYILVVVLGLGNLIDDLFLGFPVV